MGVPVCCQYHPPIFLNVAFWTASRKYLPTPRRSPELHLLTFTPCGSTGLQMFKKVVLKFASWFLVSIKSPTGCSVLVLRFVCIPVVKGGGGGISPLCEVFSCRITNPISPSGVVIPVRSAGFFFGFLGPTDHGGFVMGARQSNSLVKFKFEVPFLRQRGP